MKSTPSIRLNLGCGAVISRGWINIDKVASEHVVAGDITKPLPYGDRTVDVVYASHVLEHLDLAEADHFLREIRRVLGVGGIFRLVVPDLEEIASSYLATLRAVRSEPTEANERRYDWLVFELIDQLVRYRSGGVMLERLLSEEVDREFVRYRSGDEFEGLFSYLDAQRSMQVGNADLACIASSDSGQSYSTEKATLLNRLRSLKQKLFTSSSNRRVEAGSPTLAKDTGELHRWMYDGFSLHRTLVRAGFSSIAQVAFDQSRIVGWEAFALDSSRSDVSKPRKPFSLYFEATKENR